MRDSWYRLHDGPAWMQYTVGHWGQWRTCPANTDNQQQMAPTAGIEPMTPQGPVHLSIRYHTSAQWIRKLLDSCASRRTNQNGKLSPTVACHRGII